MKPPQFYISVTLGILCVIMSLWSVVLNQNAQELQLAVQNQQNAIAQGQQVAQLQQAVLNDMANLSVADAKIKDVLARNGYTVTANSQNAPAK